MAVNQLTAEAERFYVRLMLVVDDFGRFEAHPQILLTRCFPLQLDLYSTGDVERWMTECGAAMTVDGMPLILRYEVNQKRLLQINKFEQRARYAKYPGPEESALLSITAATSPLKARVAHASGGLQAARASHSPSTSHSNGSSSENESSESLSNLKLSVAGAVKESVKEAHWPVFLANYPNATQVDDGCRLWISLWDVGEITRETFPEVMAGLERWKTSKQWQTKGMRHSMRKWLHEKRWKDNPEQVEQSSGGY